MYGVSSVLLVQRGRYPLYTKFDLQFLFYALSGVVNEQFNFTSRCGRSCGGCERSGSDGDGSVANGGGLSSDQNCKCSH